MYRKTFALTERSLRVESRSLAGHLLRFLIVLGLLWFVVPAAGSVAMIGAMAPGRLVISVLSYSNAVLISLIGLAYFGSCITEEKEQRTLPLLLLADIGPIALLSGKLIPRVATVALILAIQIPFTFLAITLGGVLWHQILAIYVALGAYLIAVAGIGVLCSVIFRTGANAIGATGLVLLTYHVGPALLIVCGSLLADDGGPLAGFGSWLRTVSIASYAANIFTRFEEILSSGFTGQLLTVQVVSNSLAGLMAFGFALLVFNWCNASFDGEPGRAGMKPLVVVDKTLSARRPWSWPIVWKEYLLTGGGHFTAMIKIIVYGGLFGLVAYAQSAFIWNNISIVEAARVGQMILASFMVIELILLLARAYSVELSEQTWSTLSTLPYASHQLAYSKLLGVGAALWPVASWLAFSWLVLIFSRELPQLNDPQFGWGVAAIIAQVVLFLHLIVFFSVLIRNDWGAVVVAIIVLFAGDMIVGGMTAWLIAFVTSDLTVRPQTVIFWYSVAGFFETLFVIVFTHLAILLLLDRANEG